MRLKVAGSSVSDTAAVLIALCGALPGLAAAVGTYLNGRTLRKVHNATNGLVEQVVAAARVQGASDQREQDRNTAGGGAP